MIRALACCYYFFTWQRTMFWTTSIGVAVLLISPFLPEPYGFAAIMAGTIVGFMFPLMFAGIAFRQLVSNRRFVMVPQLRSFAAAGLLLLALICTGTAWLFFEASVALRVPEPTFDPKQVTLIAFGYISAYILISQWLVTYALGFIGFVLAPLLVIRLNFTEFSLASLLHTHPWLMAGAAVAGWILLFIQMRARSRPRSMAAPRWGSSTGPSSDPNYQPQWQPNFGEIATPEGTLMRGVRDGWLNRLSNVLTALLMYPALMIAVLWLIGAPLAEREQGNLGFSFFLIWSQFGTVMQCSMVMREWCARLRYQWLRRAGNRETAWRLLERALLGDLGLIAVVAAVIALLFLLLSDTMPAFLALYVLGCVLLTALSSYLAIFARARVWHPIVQPMIVMAIMLFCLFSFISNAQSETLANAYWLIPAALVLTVFLRVITRQQVMRIDWCAVRPPRRASNVLQ